MKIWALLYTENVYDATEQFHGFWPTKPRFEELKAEIIKIDPMAEDEHVLKVLEGGSHRVSEKAIKWGGVDFALTEEESIPFDLSLTP